MGSGDSPGLQILNESPGFNDFNGLQAGWSGVIGPERVQLKDRLRDIAAFVLRRPIPMSEIGLIAEVTVHPLDVTKNGASARGPARSSVSLRFE
jgi:hypothetical protein